MTRIGRLSFAGTGRVRFRKIRRLKLSLTVSFIRFALAGAQAGPETHLLCGSTNAGFGGASRSSILVDRLPAPERAPHLIEGAQCRIAI